MKIEVNNVYQKKSISKVKLGIVIGAIVILIVVGIWRLYYERAQTMGVSSFAEFIGIEGFFKSLDLKEQNISKNGIEQNLDEAIIPNEEQKNDIEAELPQTLNQYIPNVTLQSIENINKIYNLNEDGQKLAYLTFDDGPSRDVTLMLLDILKEENITATFFVLGNKVEQNPDILKRIYNEGHYIGNHGYSHVYSKVYESSSTILDEYNKCEEAIRTALSIPNYSTCLFRFPGGSIGGPYNGVKQVALQSFKESNIAVLDWNCLTKDSEGNFPKEELYQNFIQSAER